MNYGLYISASGAKAQMDRQAVITNNIANAHTSGFKRDLVNIQERRNAGLEDPTMRAYLPPDFKNASGGVVAVGEGIDLTPSSFKDTANPRDFALNGKGFFTVQGANGETLLTRDGRFMIDQSGTLRTVTSGNLAVLDNTGKPVVVNPSLPVNVANDGTIAQAGNPLDGKLGVMNVPDPRQLVKIGGNMLKNNGPLTAAPAETQVLQGKLEDSGVDPMLEIVNMIDGQRAFEANTKMMTFQDTLMSELNTVGRVA